jgi:hypothetical protein
MNDSIGFTGGQGEAMKRSPKASKRLLLLAVLLVLGAGAGVAWTERTTLRAWYYLRGLKRATGAEVQVWARRVAGVGRPVVPDLLRLLADDDAQVCDNAHAALDSLAQRWGRADPRCPELLDRLVEEFPRLSDAGQRQALALALDWTRPGACCPIELAAAAASLLPQTARRPALHEQGLQLALGLVRQTNDPSLVSSVQELTRVCLHDSASATRVRAIQIAAQPAVGFGREVVPLLGDSEAVVRRAALAVVGPAEDLVLTDNLLPWLHDPDAEVRRLCEGALRRRGLTAQHIRLARLITHPSWSVRLETLDHLGESEDLDAGVWLRRLSHDPSPAVRVAAIRAACEDCLADLGDRLDQMARQDPSATVSQLARHYRARRRTADPRQPARTSANRLPAP